MTILEEFFIKLFRNLLPSRKEYYNTRWFTSSKERWLLYV